MAADDPLVVPPSQRPALSTWGLDPLWDAHVKLLAVQLGRLVAADEAADGTVVWLGNHPVRSVELVGVAIGVETRTIRATGKDFYTITLDDSTGLVECKLFDGPPPPQGALLHVLGKVGHWRRAGSDEPVAIVGSEVEIF